MATYTSVSATELICACAESSDSSAWREFIARFQKPISLSILRIANKWGACPAEIVDDLVQETYLKLCADRCRLLQRFTLQHPEAVEGYVKKIAINIAHDHFKSLSTQKRGSGETVLLGERDVTFAPDGPGSRNVMEREVLMKEIGECLEACLQEPYSERDRMMFWLYYQQGLSAAAIAALPGIGLSDKGVESAIGRLTRLVRQRIVGIRSETDVSRQLGEKGLRTAESY